MKADDYIYKLTEPEKVTIRKLVKKYTDGIEKAIHKIANYYGQEDVNERQTGGEGSGPADS